MSNGWHRTYKHFRRGLDQSGEPLFQGLAHGTVSVELYEPRGRANVQTPHPQDELYVVREGTARFDREGEVIDVAAGDVMFIEAGTRHHFFDSSEDFSLWVIFFGPVGGEGGQDADRRDQAVRPE